MLHATRQQLGALFTLRLLGQGPVVVLCDPDLVSQVHQMDDREVLAGTVRGRMLGELVGSRVSMRLDGEAHQKRRRAVAPAFGARSLRRRIPRFRHRIDRELARWPRATPLRIQEPLDEVALGVALEVFFHATADNDRATLRHHCRRYLAAMRPLLTPRPHPRWNLGPLTAWGRFRAARRALEAVLAGEIRRRRSVSPRDPVAPVDLFGMLMTAPLEDTPEARAEAVQHELCGLLVGGTETVAKSIAWTLLGVLQNEEFSHRLRQEIDGVTGGKPLEEHHLEHMPYLDAVVHEGLRAQRLTPILGYREAQEDLVVGGFSLPAGTVMAQAHAETGRNDRFPYPDRFHPDNFFERQVSFRDYLPFGGGHRICTGMALGQLEMTLVLAILMQRFDFDLLDGQFEPAASGLAFEPKNFVVRLRDRTNTP